MTVIGRRRFIGWCMVSAVLLLAACTGEEAQPETSDPAADTAPVVSDSAAPSTEPPAGDDPDGGEAVGNSTDNDSTDGGEAVGPGRPQAAGSDPVDDSGLWLGRGAMTESGIELVWSELDEVVAYRIHRFSRDDLADPDEPPLTEESLVHDTGSVETFIDRSVNPGGRYWYVLAAFDDNDELVARRWTVADAVTDDEPPTAVTGLSATVGNGAVTLTWDRSADNYRFERYAIRRSIDGEPSVYYGTGWTIDQTSFVDDQLPTSGTVTYEVIATDFHDNRAEAAVVSVSL